MVSRDFDVVLYGASGFTGRQTVLYFRDHAPPGLRWAIAGRNESKLTAVAHEALPENPPPVLIADGGDREALDKICSRTRVVLTTAGPFSMYGRALVDACVAHGVHYVDITGETPFAADLITAHHETARAQGTRIIPFSGFDSIPSDLGSFYCAQVLRSKGTTTRHVCASFKARGGLNGGTVATALEMGDSGRLTDLNNVLLLNPCDHQTDEERNESPDATWPRKDETLGIWLAPFVMGPINSRVVRRSNALLAETGEAYGPSFRYEERYEAGGRFAATMMSMGMATADTMLRFKLGRAIVRAVTPSPGQGPSEAVMDGGFFRCRLVALGDDGSRILVTLSADGDPGNRVTVAALCESAIALTQDPDTLPGGPGYGGILTPATGLGSVLVDRLIAAGWRFESEVLDGEREEGA